MRKIYLSALIFYPLYAFPAVEVRPEGYKLFWLLIVIVLPLLFLAGSRIKSRRSKGTARKKQHDGHKMLFTKRLKVTILKDKTYRPGKLTLIVQNISARDIDIEAPVIEFRKLLSRRKFKLKGVNQSSIYPLYLDAGKTHELPVQLSVFHHYDRKLKSYYWCRVLLQDTNGRKYSTKYITLRSSLFS